MWFATKSSILCYFRVREMKSREITARLMTSLKKVNFGLHLNIYVQSRSLTTNHQGQTIKSDLLYPEFAQSIALVIMNFFLVASLWLMHSLSLSLSLSLCLSHTHIHTHIQTHTDTHTYTHTHKHKHTHTHTHTQTDVRTCIHRRR